MVKVPKQALIFAGLLIFFIFVLQQGPLRREPSESQAEFTKESNEFTLKQIRKLLKCTKYMNTNLKTTKTKPEGHVPPIYVITPTFPRPVQIPELTRLGQTLKLVENVVWIVAEDAQEPTMQVIELLNDLGIYYQYLQTPMPKRYQKKDRQKWPKGVENRNKGVQWILNYVKETGDDSGVFYFADDDNTYDIRIFDQMRKTKKLSLFPVGAVSGRPVSSPLLHKNGSLIEFYEGWLGNRTFAVDMAGFAVNVKHFVSVNRKQPVLMDYKKGYEEESFLKRLEVLPKDAEFLADNCSKIYVWHTKTENPSFKNFKTIDINTLKTTNLGQLMRYWCLFTPKELPCLEDDDTFDDNPS